MRLTIALLLCLGVAACGTFTKPSEPAAYVVFFMGNDITLNPQTQTIVDQAASDAKTNATADVEVTGPSTKIAPGYDPKFAQPRIDAVIRALIADGVAENRIVRTSPTLKIKTDASGAERVEIRVVSKPKT